VTGPGRGPLVSVIVPTCNRARIVPETIDSVLGQTYPNLEVIVVDDGSTDGTPDVLRDRYGDRVRIVTQANAGVEAARRHGKQVAAGDYLNFLDDDDLMYPDKLEQQVAVLTRSRRAGIVHCAYDYVGERGEYLQTSRFLPEGDVRAQLTRGCFPWSGGPLIRRECLELIGDDEHRDWYGDWGMWLRIALGGYTFECVPEPLGAYRMLPGSMTDALVRNVERLVLNVLSWVFANGAPPNGDVASRRAVYAGWHAWIAFRYYAGGHWEDGARNLRAALSLDPPPALDGRRLARAVVRDAVTPRMRVQDPLRFVDGVFDHLPPPASHALPLHDWARGATLLQVGVCELGAGRRAEGAEHLRRAIEIDPDIAVNVPRFAIAVASHARNLLDERHRGYLADVFDSLPDSARPLLRARSSAEAQIALARAQDLRREGRPARAIALGARAVAAEPSLLGRTLRRRMR
jgi:glycosyltransferase involved in cell wall biosynthesis